VRLAAVFLRLVACLFSGCRPTRKSHFNQSISGDYIMKKLLFILALFSVSLFLQACNSGGGSATGGKTVKTSTANNLTVTLATASGVIKDGENDFTLTFADAAGKPVDVGAVSVNFHMPAMGTMPVMNDAATLTTSGTPGVYNGKVKLQMAGDWQTQIAFEGAAGKGKTIMPIVAQ
jgi:hypothetical protein